MATGQDGASEYHDDGLSSSRQPYKDNRFLTTDDRLALENEQDEYYRGGLFLREIGAFWAMSSSATGARGLERDEKTADKLYFGLDFGFSSDPCAVVNCTTTRRTNAFMCLTRYMSVD